MSPTPKPDQRHSDASQPAPTPQTSADPVEPALTVGRTQPSDPPNRDPVNLTGPLSVAGRTLLPNRSGYSRGFREDLLSLVELVEAGALTTVIDRTYGLDQTPEAMTYLSTDEGTGSEPLVLTVCPGSGLATASISRYEVGPFATDVKGGLEPPCCCQTDAGRRRSGRQDSNLRPRWREVSTCRRERWRPGDGFFSAACGRVTPGQMPSTRLCVPSREVGPKFCGLPSGYRPQMAGICPSQSHVGDESAYKPDSALCLVSGESGTLALLAKAG